MFRTAIAVLAAITAGLIYFLNLLFEKRREMDGLPCPPMKSRLLGHLDIAGEIERLLPPGSHPHNLSPYIQKKYGQGDCFYLDLWPLGPRFFFSSNPEVTSRYITTTNSLPKSPLMAKFVNLLLGNNNMVTVDGQQWKHLRSIFNPGFSAQHLMTLVPYIVDAGQVFSDIIAEKARTNQLFELEEYATRLTVDIIGKVVLDADFNSQKTPHPIVDAFRERVLLMPIAKPALDFSWLQFRRRLKLWLNGRTLDRLIGEELDLKMESCASATKSSTERKRSVVDLALDAYRMERNDLEERSANQPMDPVFRQNSIDSIKTFIFGGHDTTASTIAYIFYLLHFHPEVHKKVVVELDMLFSPGATTTSIAANIKADPYMINRLEYTAAVIKETLRLFPPASTVRELPAQSDSSKIIYLTHPETGQQLPLSGFVAWPVVNLVSHNESFFPDPAQFIPERFIPAMTPFPNSKLFTPAGKDAWRPFEKGPRNCIGQELAMIEMKVIVAMSVKDLDFVAEFDGVRCEAVVPVETYKEFEDGKPGKERMTIEGHAAFQVLKGSAKPRGAMPGRLSFRKG